MFGLRLRLRKTPWQLILNRFWRTLGYQASDYVAHTIRGQRDILEIRMQRFEEERRLYPKQSILKEHDSIEIIEIKEREQSL